MPTFALLAHRQPQLVARLVGRLAPHRVVVHVDKGVPVSPFVEALAEHRHCELIPDAERVTVTWAGYSVVSAQLALYRRCLEVTAQDDHIVLLSGQDYPLVGVENVVDFLASAPYRQHIRLYSPEGILEKERQFSRRHYQDSGFFGHPQRGTVSARVSQRICNVMRWLSGPWPNRVPDGLVLAYGSQWTALTADCLDELIRMATPEIRRFFSHVWAPDERFFH